MNSNELEDILNFIDDPIAARAADPTQDDEPTPTPPIEDDEEDDDTDVDDTPDPTPDPTPPTPDPTPKKDKTTSTDDDDDNSLTAYYDFIKEQNLILVDDDFEFDGTEEGLEKAIQSTQSKLIKGVQESLWNSLPEDFKPVLEYALAGGTDIKSFISSSKASIKDYDITKETDQKDLLKLYYKKTTKFSDDKINKLIASAELDESLEDEAQEAYDSLSSFYEEEQQETIQQKTEEREQALQQEEQWRDNIKELVKTNSQIEDKRKTKVQAFMLNQIKKGDKTTTDFSRVLASISNNPEHLVQLADILYDYNEKQGLNLDRLTAKTKTKATKALRDRLSEATQSRTKIKSGTSKNTTSDFDWEEFIRQN